ncbi:MAG: TIGR00730 family Rossman fold protein [Desulfovibrionaceae bacterium]
MYRSRQYLIDDLSMQESWRLFKIMAEFVDGFESLADLGPAVSVFGSARCEAGCELYQQAETLARHLVEAGFSVITGGGPGLMEAANKGAHEAGGQSVGLHIHLPLEQHSNNFMSLKCNFKYFFIRKVMFIKYATAYVALPGGFGTMDELYEALVLIQTKRIKPFPIVLLGAEFWSGLADWMSKALIQEGFIAPEDMDLFKIVDDPQEAASFIRRHVVV